MALFASAARDLRTEVEGRIRDLSPSSRSTKRFKKYDDKASTRTAIDAFTGASRVFQVGMPKEVENTYFGKTTVNRLYEFPITFVYQRTMSWSLAAIDDMEKIRYDLLITSGAHGVTGVGNRHIDPQTQVTIEHHAQDPWDYYTLRLLAWFEMDHS